MGDSILSESWGIVLSADCDGNLDLEKERGGR